MLEHTYEEDHTAAEEILSFWEQMDCRNARFVVDGMVYAPEEAALKTVREDGVYMADYVLGEDGQIAEVRYDKIR